MTPVITKEMKEQIETLLKHGSRVEVLIEQGKVTNTGKVEGIFDDRNITQDMRLHIHNLRLHYLKILILRVAGVMYHAVFIHHILNTQNGLIPQAVVIDNKGIPGVKGVNLKGGVIFLPFFIREYHAEGRTADMEPVSQFLILCGLFLCKDELIKLVDSVRKVFPIATGHILQRLTHQIPRLKRHNLVRPVLHNPVRNLWSYLLLPVKDRLLAFVVSPEVLNFRPVFPVVGKRLTQNGHYIVNGYFGCVCFNHTPAMQYHSHAAYLLSHMVYLVLLYNSPILLSSTKTR